MQTHKVNVEEPSSIFQSYQVFALNINVTSSPYQSLASTKGALPSRSLHSLSDDSIFT